MTVIFCLSMLSIRSSAKLNFRRIESARFRVGWIGIRLLAFSGITSRTNQQAPPSHFGPATPILSPFPSFWNLPRFVFLESASICFLALNLDI
ncbi:hypothetical protein RchiOBHm_Chr7g0241791 [Rosa chinensis]|uniref:Uncharacterized protein n=1 Tax=Rosa chinensis TaxID=74649 RepID=A0A2P6PIB6_ROSCH|nr:hypothetical protein RchiOBHm_Chr7g0241791 [Rosa chinensis]